MIIRLAFPPQSNARQVQVLLLDQQPEGYLILHYGADARFLGDTFHDTIEECLTSAKAQLGGLELEWTERSGELPVILSELFPAPTVTLYRPVGQRELDLIAESGYSCFPPRLPSQPIFYPVLNEDYAATIARDWNTKDAASGHIGYVTRFCVRRAFLSNYQVQVVGNRSHQEYWIPAEDIFEFNQAIVGKIEVIAEFSGKAQP